jgi:DNA-binding response OmpR family regulator
MGLLQEGAREVQRYGDDHLVIDFQQEVALLDQQRITLTRKDYELLALLVRNAEEIVPRQALLQQVWGYSPEIRTRTLDVHVQRLRKRLGCYAKRYIETIFGIGYRFQRFHASRNPVNVSVFLPHESLAYSAGVGALCEVARNATRT